MMTEFPSISVADWESYVADYGLLPNDSELLVKLRRDTGYSPWKAVLLKDGRFAVLQNGLSEPYLFSSFSEYYSSVFNGMTVLYRAAVQQSYIPDDEHFISSLSSSVDLLSNFFQASLDTNDIAGLKSIEWLDNILKDQYESDAERYLMLIDSSDLYVALVRLLSEFFITDYDWTISMEYLSAAATFNPIAIHHGQNEKRINVKLIADGVLTEGYQPLEIVIAARLSD